MIAAWGNNDSIEAFETLLVKREKQVPEALAVAR